MKRSSSSAGEVYLSPAPLILLDSDPEDQDSDDVPLGSEEEVLDDDDLDTDRVASDPEQVPGAASPSGSGD